VDAVIGGLCLLFGDDAFARETREAVPDVELRPLEGLDRVVAGDHRETGLRRDLDDAGAHRAGAEDADLAGVRLH
jgi:hypothetical protein